MRNIKQACGYDSFDGMEENTSVAALVDQLDLYTAIRLSACPEKHSHSREEQPARTLSMILFGTTHCGMCHREACVDGIPRQTLPATPGQSPDWRQGFDQESRFNTKLRYVVPKIFQCHGTVKLRLQDEAGEAKVSLFV